MTGVQTCALPIFGVLNYSPNQPGGITAERHKYEVRFWCLAFVVLGGVCFFGAILQYWLIEIVGERTTHYLRYESFKAMLRQEVGWFDDRRHMTGVLTTRLATDATLIHQLTGNQLTVVFQMVSAIAAGIVVAFVGNWKIALVILACIPVIIITTGLHMRYMVGYAQRAKKAYEQTGKIASEAIENVRTVVSLAREPTFATAFVSELTKPAKQGLRTTVIHSLGSAFQQLTQFWLSALAFWYGSKIVADPKENVDFTGLMKAQSGIMFGAQSVGMLSAFFPDFGKALSAAYHMFQLFDRKPAIPYPKAVKHAKMDEFQRKQFAEDRAAKMKTIPMSISESAAGISTAAAAGETIEDFQGEIEFRDVTFSYPTRQAVTVLTGLGFLAKPQQTVAIVGQSGCGKSTVVSLIERLYDPTGGMILLDGKPISDLDIEWMRSQVGIVSQEPILFATTIYDNILYGKPSATREEVIEAAKQANAHEFISGFPDGYETLVGEKGVTLSGGQKQRVAIARALVRNPKILLLDESTSALDAESERVVQQALDRARLGRTTIVIAHRLSTIRDADRIVVIHEGKVVETGTHSELLELNGHYALLASAQTI